MITFIHPHDNSEIQQTAYLRNPELTDTEELELNLTVQILLSGDLYSKRVGEPIETLHLELRELANDQFTALMGLFLRAQETNKQVRYIDYNGKTWIGKFIDPNLSVGRILRHQETDDCKFWNATLNFRGYLQHTNITLVSFIDINHGVDSNPASLGNDLNITDEATYVVV